MNIKQILFSLVLIVSAMTNCFSAKKYKFLEQELGKSSSLYCECKNNRRGVIWKNDKEKACDLLENTLEQDATIDINSLLKERWDFLANWAGVMTIALEKAVKENAIQLILTNYDDEVKFEEDKKFEQARSKLRHEFEQRKQAEIQRKKENQSKPKYPR